MNDGRPDPRPLGLLGAALLGLGLGLRLLLPDEPSSSPIEGALARIPLFAGAAVVLLERVLRAGAAVPWHWWLLPLAIVPGCFPQTAIGLTRAADWFAAIAAGVALRDLVLHDGMGGTLRRWLIALGVVLAAIGIAQFLWQRADLRDFVAGSGDDRFSTAAGQAFLASDRASGTLVNANAFAGLLAMLLALAAGAATNGSVRAAWPCAVIGLGFLAAGSAGALLSLLLAMGAFLRTGRHPAWRLGFGVGVLGVLVLIGSLATGWRPPVIGDKVGTFAHRVDYHRLGARMLGDVGLIGTGIESTRELRRVHAVPDEAHSDYLHDTYLQLGIELGPAGVVLALLAVILARTRDRARDPSRPGNGPPPAFVAAFGGGVVLGVAIPPLLNGIPRLVPLSWEIPIVDAVLIAGLVAAVARALRDAPTSRAAGLWTLGFVAFAVHGVLDYDVYTPAAATTFAAFCALAPGRPTARGADRPIALIGAVVLLAMPLAAGVLAMQRHEAWSEFRPSPGRPQAAATPHAAIELLRRFPDPRVLENVSRRLSRRDGPRVEAVLDGLSDTVRQWPSFRQAEADHLARRALVEPGFRAEARERVIALSTREELVHAWILTARIRIERLLGNAQAVRELARAALKSMDLWQIEAPQWRERLLSDAR